MENTGVEKKGVENKGVENKGVENKGGTAETPARMHGMHGQKRATDRGTEKELRAQDAWGGEKRGGVRVHDDAAREEYRPRRSHTAERNDAPPSERDKPPPSSGIQAARTDTVHSNRGKKLSGGRGRGGAGLALQQHAQQVGLLLAQVHGLQVLFDALQGHAHADHRLVDALDAQVVRQEAATNT